MAENEITVTLGRGRTKTQAFKDAALSNDWKTKVEKVTDIEERFELGEPVELATGAIDIKEFTTVGGAIDVTYKIKEMVNNPVSQVDFGKQIWGKLIDEQDREVAAKAAKIRDEQAQDAGDVTTVA